ncbi:MAG: carbonic anhydrase [Chthonomonadaceae bacterium]|nr:carbonic anhydrase [Chthonomonadaceae bacterium]
MANDEARRILEELKEGNRRFREGRSQHRTYSQPELAHLAAGQAPRAAIVACSDSRVVPEVLFDQPLGALFVSRVPGNVASDGTRWMIEIAMSAFEIPLVVVLGHTGCLAVKSIVEDTSGSEGGLLRLKTIRAVARARMRPGGDLLRTAVEENARSSVEELSQESAILRAAIVGGRTHAVAMVYEMETGTVHDIVGA